MHCAVRQRWQQSTSKLRWNVSDPSLGPSSSDRVPRNSRRATSLHRDIKYQAKCEMQAAARRKQEMRRNTKMRRDEPLRRSGSKFHAFLYPVFLAEQNRPNHRGTILCVLIFCAWRCVRCVASSRAIFVSSTSFCQQLPYDQGSGTRNIRMSRPDEQRAILSSLPLEVSLTRAISYNFVPVHRLATAWLHRGALYALVFPQFILQAVNMCSM